MIGSDRLYNPVHRGDAYGRLDALCAEKHWRLGVAPLRDGLALRVYLPDKPYRGARFAAGHENDAAAELLAQLRHAA